MGAELCGRGLQVWIGRCGEETRTWACRHKEHEEGGYSCHKVSCICRYLKEEEKKKKDEDKNEKKEGEEKVWAD